MIVKITCAVKNAFKILFLKKKFLECQENVWVDFALL